MKAKLTTLTPEKRVEYKHSKQDHILSYDVDNKYPQRVQDIVNDSKSAVSGLRIRKKHIQGDGFKDLEFSKTKINRQGLKVDQLLKLISDDVAYFESFALHVNYNSLSEIVEVHFIPFSNCRIGKSDDKRYDSKIAVYDDWGKVKKSTIKFSDITFYDQYEPEKVLEQVEELTIYDDEGNVLVNGWDLYKGQILYVTPIKGEYPLAYFDSVLEDMQTESQTKRFKFNASKNNFLASHIVVTGKKESEEDADEFVETLSEFQGGDNAGKLLWLEKESNDDPLELKKLDVQAFDGTYKHTEESTSEAIYTLLNIPLALVKENTGLTQDDIKNASQYYSGITLEERNLIKYYFEEVFERYYKKINRTNDYSIIPLTAFYIQDNKISPEYFPYYTTNEIRIANGDEAIQVEGGSEKLLVEILGVGGTQALTGILQDQILTTTQKQGVLKTLFGLNDEQISQMLGINI